MLITLMLVMALITIAMLSVLPAMKQQILRDREEEMTHRGTAYMRAIQHFYKKFGRYPMRVEELENTNNLHFIRKRYKDPMNTDPVTGKEKDFKFLHQTDISLNNGMVLGQTPGQNLLGGQGGLSGQGGLGTQGGLGGLQGGLGGAGAQQGRLSQTGSAGGQPSASGDSGSPSNAGGNSNSAGSSSSNSDTSSNSGSGFNGPTFGGGPILGVASMSKAKTIRVFYDKNHYNDWLFIYLPQADRGGLLTGPVNPGMPTGNVGGVAPGQMPGGALGQGGFGQGQGLMPNGGQNQGFQTQTPQAPAQAPQQ
ncbi:MAG: hypothetical protein ACHP9V_06265 [Terriglobales bacterium]